MANEKRLIDANDALERLKKARKEMSIVSFTGVKAVPIDAVIQFVENCKSVDAVEVVRCKDCLNYEETMGKDSGKPCGYGRCLHTDGLPGIVFYELFCSYGERREGECK